MDRIGFEGRNCLRGIVCAIFLLALSGAARAQYTDRQAIDDLGGPQSFAARRSDLAKRCKAGYVVLFARNEIPEAVHYREDNDFYYFTGLQDPGAVMVLDCAKDTTIILEPEQTPQTAKTYGPNLLALSPADRESLGYKSVMSIANIDIFLSYITHSPGAADARDLWIRFDFPDKADGARPETGRDNAWKYAHPYHEPIPANLAPTKLIMERYPMAHFQDVTPFIDEMRNIKRPEEIEVLRRNGKISADGDKEGMAHARPGMYQYQIEARATGYFMDHGAQGLAYLAIVSSGADINTIHYFSDRHKIEPNQLVVLDYGASLDHMTMDITRTFNISGKFTPEQAKWYAVELDAQKTTLALLTPGHTYEEASAAGKAIYDKAGVGDQWRGFPGHFLGLATHDVMRPTGPVKPGQVVTVEPFIDLPDKQMHYRVEDTVLITNGAPEILSAAIPKELDEVEKLVGSAKD